MTIESNKRPFRWAFIGAGNIANVVAKDSICDGANIVSVWNRSPKRKEKFAQKFHVSPYESALEAINRDDVDGVYVNVVHSKHYDFVKLCLENKKPVLCEKALTLNYKQAKELFDLAEKNNVYFSEAMWTWHSPVAKQVKKWIKENRLGKIISVEGSFGYPMLLVNHNKRLTDINLGGGAILDLGVYCIRYAYELFGIPKNISCKGKVKNGADLDDLIVFEYDGFNAVLRCSFTNFRGHYFKIVGEKGYIKVPAFNMAHKAIIKTDKKESFVFKGRLFSEQFKEVEKEILSGNINPVNVTKESSLDVMKLMDECRKQIGVIYPEER